MRIRLCLDHAFELSIRRYNVFKTRQRSARQAIVVGNLHILSYNICMGEEYCETKKGPCNPRDCNREYCLWRDTKWIRRALQQWAYSTGDSKKDKTPPKKDSEQNHDKFTP